MKKGDKFWVFQLREQWRSERTPVLLEGVVTGGGQSQVMGILPEWSYRANGQFQRSRHQFEAVAGSTPAEAFDKVIIGIDARIERIQAELDSLVEDRALTDAWRAGHAD